MQKRLSSLLLVSLFLSACTLFSPRPVENQSLESPAPPSETPIPSPTDTLVPPTATVTQTPRPTFTPTLEYPPQGYGPKNFPPDINPLTGLSVADTDTLDRRPVAIKVNIVPRTSTRPPWGLSKADIVYDYYQNDGYTRFHVIFLGDEATQVGPIRSARFPDDSLIRMYKSIFAYGSADRTINSRLLNSEYFNRLVLEGGGTALCPPTEDEPLCRYDPNGYDFLLGGTEEIRAAAVSNGTIDARQNLDGMHFQLDPPQGGKTGNQATIRYSGDDYTRWEYDPDTGLYMRFQDNVLDTGQGEEYDPLTDREYNDEQISAANVVVMLTPHSYFRQPPSEIVEILLFGTGKAYAFRDGQAYEVNWSIPTQDSVLTLTLPDGSPFPFKPGNTWIQVVGQSSVVTQPEVAAWRFEFKFP